MRDEFISSAPYIPLRHDPLSIAVLWRKDSLAPQQKHQLQL
jgi:hypothetical protein